jgi:hypothetical protein
MGAANQPAAFQPSQVAPDAGSRRAGNLENFFNRGGSGPEKKFNNQFTASIQCVSHTAPILPSPVKKNKARIYIF